MGATDSTTSITQYPDVRRTRPQQRLKALAIHYGDRITNINQ